MNSLTMKQKIILGIIVGAMLIVIGVALETYRQLESSLVNRNYKGGK